MDIERIDYGVDLERNGDTENWTRILDK
jgi:hypothetical protein